MLQVVPAKQAKENFGAVMRRVYEDDEPQIIERLGMPVVAWVSMKDFERLYPDRVEQLPGGKAAAARAEAAKRLHALLDQMQRGNERFSEDEVEADVMKAFNQVRHGKKKR